MGNLTGFRSQMRDWAGWSLRHLIFTVSGPFPRSETIRKQFVGQPQVSWGGHWSVIQRLHPHPAQLPQGWRDRCRPICCDPLGNLCPEESSKGESTNFNTATQTWLWKPVLPLRICTIFGRLFVLLLWTPDAKRGAVRVKSHVVTI